MQVVRFEHEADGHGIFRSCRTGYLEGTIIENTFDRHSGFPVPRDDGLDMYKNDTVWFCAYKNIEQVQQWLMPDEIKLLIEEGFNILLLEVEDFQEGRFQVIYTKESILSSVNINSLFI